MGGLLVTSLSCFLSLLALILGLLYMYFKTSYKYFEKRGLPYDQPSFPFGSFTSTSLLKKSFTSALADVYDRHKRHKMVGFFALCTPQILINDLDIIKQVLVKDFDVFADRGMYYDKQRDPLSSHLFSLEGKEWKSLRAKLTPTFTSGKIKGMFPNVVGCGEQIVKYVENLVAQGKAVDCKSLFQKYGQIVIASTAFGLDSDSITNDDSVFYKMANRMVDATVQRLIIMTLMFNVKVARFLKIRIVPQDATEFFLKLVRDTIKYRESNGVVRNDYLQLLMQLRESGISDSEGSGWSLSNEELTAQAFVFVVAGSETTSSTLSFCLYELALNPDVQLRVQSELDDLTELSYDSVSELRYLDMVVDETLRKYSPLGFLNRECQRDYLVPGTDTVIEKGTQVYVSVRGLHHDPELFHEPEKFIPERFSKENKDKIKPYTFMPFGEGPRYCIGMRFARVATKTALAMLLSRFQVSLEPETPVPARIEPRTIITLPEGGLWLRLEDRKPLTFKG